MGKPLTAKEQRLDRNNQVISSVEGYIDEKEGKLSPSWQNL